MQSIATNMGIVLAARTIGSIFAFISTAFIARTLNPEGYGDFSAVLAFLFLFNTLADFGLYSILTREIARRSALDEKNLVSNTFTIRIVSLAVFLSAGVLLMRLLPYSAEVKDAAPLAALSYFFLSVSQVLMGVFQKYFKMFWVAAAELIGRALHLGLSAALYLTTGSIFLFLGSLALSALVQLVLVVVFARKLTPFSLRVDLKTWREVLRAAFPVSLSLLFVLIYFKSDTVLLSLLAPDPRRDTGIYNIAYKLLESIIFFPAALVGLVMPLLSAARDNNARFRLIFQKTWDALWLFCVPIVVGGMLLAPAFIALLGGREFTAAETPLRMLMVAIGFIFFGTLLGQAIIARDLQHRAIKVYFWGMVINITANALLIPMFSYNAAASTTVLTEMVVTLGLVWILWKEAHILPVFNGRALKPLVASGVMGFALWISADPIFAHWGLAALPMVLAAAATLYFSVLFAAGGIRRDDVAFFMQPQE